MGRLIGVTRTSICNCDPLLNRVDVSAVKGHVKVLLSSPADDAPIITKGPDHDLANLPGER